MQDLHRLHYSTNNNIMSVIKTLHNVVILLCIVSLDARIDVNVALNRPSHQVSTWIDPDGNKYSAKYANDGNNDTGHVSGPCVHTHLETNPWWAVDLLVALYVAGVKFTNRGDCDPCGTYASSDSSFTFRQVPCRANTAGSSEWRYRSSDVRPSEPAALPSFVLVTAFPSFQLWITQCQIYKILHSLRTII